MLILLSGRVHGMRGMEKAFTFGATTVYTEWWSIALPITCINYSFSFTFLPMRKAVTHTSCVVWSSSSGVSPSIVFGISWNSNLIDGFLD